MSKFYGKVGYAITTEKVVDGKPTGVWIDSVVDRQYFGDVFKTATRWQESDKVNDDLTISNTISIVADGFAYEHFSSIKYVEWMGVRWKAKSIEVKRPRLIINLGGEYNGE